jgi:GDP-L-fucose synthase
MEDPSGMHALSRDAVVYVAGHRGLVGSAVWRHLQERGFTRLVGRNSRELDLRDRPSVLRFVQEQAPEAVVVAAARVGGILANSTYPADFLSENLQIQVNLLDAAQRAAVPRLLFLGSSCIYPKLAEQPIREDSLLTGPLEPTNDAYAIAKIAGIMQVQAVRRQHGLPWISAMPTNLYGPGDNFDPQTSHVLPAMLQRFSEAAATGAASVTCWGSGAPRREFLYVDDLAAAALFLLEHYDDPETINVGTGEDVSIAELAQSVAAVVGYSGGIAWDTTKPDGTARKLLDVSKLQRLGWKASVRLDDGLQETYRWYQEHVADLRR